MNELTINTAEQKQYMLNTAHIKKTGHNTLRQKEFLWRLDCWNTRRNRATYKE
jgi:hypothetical protein